MTTTTPDRDFVVLPRAALFEFFGKMALPPWKDADGTVIGGSIDCAPIAEEIARWVDSHDVAQVVDVPVDHAALLKKYIAHVGACEGTTFIGGLEGSSFLNFTAEEKAVLERLDDETLDEQLARERRTYADRDRVD